MAELHSIEEKTLPKEYVSYKPERLALHEIIVAVSTTLQLEDEQDLQKVCEAIYAEVVKDLKLDELRTDCGQDVRVQMDDYLRTKNTEHIANAQTRGICEQVQASERRGVEYGQYTETSKGKKDGWTAEQVMVERSTDILYTERATELIKPLVAEKLAKYATEQGYDTLTIPKQSERLTLMIAGGAASGKGSSVARLQEFVEGEGIRWSNIVKMNMDSYKPLLIKPDAQNPVKPELFSQLAQQEASVIHQKIDNLLLKMEQNGIAPHVFVDRIWLTKEKSEYGLMNGGKVRAIVVSTDVEDAINRSYQRGKEIGRYEHTEGLLRGHGGVSRQLSDALGPFLGQDFILVIIDNNVPKGQQGQDVMLIDLQNKVIEIYSSENLQKFVNKVQINEKAKSKAELYSATEHNANAEAYMQKFIDKGFTVLNLQKTQLETEAPEVQPAIKRQGS